MTQIAEIVSTIARLTKLAARRESEGLYTDADICLNAVSLLSAFSHLSGKAGAEAGARQTLIYEALRFAHWAAGEGICPVDGEDADAPDEFLMDYSTATGDEDWATIPTRLAALSPAAVAPDNSDLIREARQVAGVVDNYEGKNYLIRRLSDALERSQPVAPGVGELREALTDNLAHLVAATSLLKRSPKTAAASNKMFDQMVADYEACIERGRATLSASPVQEGK